MATLDAKQPIASRRASVRREREREMSPPPDDCSTSAAYKMRQLGIARAVGSTRRSIYRHFSSKEELYVLTLSGYLTDSPTASMAWQRHLTHRTAGGGLACYTTIASSTPLSWTAACA